MSQESTVHHGRGSNGSSEQSDNRGTIVQRAHARAVHHVRRLCTFGKVVRAIWPVKSALHLAQAEGCSERSAQYQIDGRKPTAKAIHAVDGEMLD